MGLDINVTMADLLKELQDILDNPNLIKNIQKNKDGINKTKNNKILNTLEYYQYVKNIMSNEKTKENFLNQYSDDLSIKMTQSLIKIEDYTIKNYPKKLTPIEQMMMKMSGKTDKEIKNHSKIVN